MKLDKRMTALLSEIPKNINLADIGADHGIVSINYALNNPSNFVVGSDISKKSIEKAAKTAKKLNLTNYYTTVGNGLAPIKNFDIDVILISGMGGEEIIKIIDSNKKYPFYVLSPQKNSDKVRLYLKNNNLKAIKDYKVLSDSKFYDIIVCTQGVYNPTEFEVQFGSGKGEDFKLFSTHTTEYLTKLLQTIKKEEDRFALIQKLNLLSVANNN